MSGPSGNQLVLFSLESWCFPRLRLEKTKVFPLGSDMKCTLSLLVVPRSPKQILSECSLKRQMLL